MKVWIRSNIGVLLVGSFSKLANNYFEARKQLTKIKYIASAMNEPLYVVSSSIRTVDSRISTIEFPSDL